MRAANDQASLHIRIVSPDNVLKFILPTVGDKVCYPSLRKKKNNCLDDLGFSTYAEK